MFIGLYDNNYLTYIYMVNMIENKYISQDMNIELTSCIDRQQNLWFRGKEITEILGYSKTRDALLKHVDNEDRQLISWRPQNVDGRSQAQNRYYTFVNESGFYSLVLSSRLETTKKFKHWVTSQVLPSIRKYGQYKLFDSPWNKMIMIDNETDLHYKVMDLIRKYYQDSILVGGLRFLPVSPM